MTPEQSKSACKGDIQMIDIKFLSHFAQLCRKSKERYEGSYQIPFCEEWFSLPSNEYNPGLAYASMGICLSGYKNLPSNGYKYILGSMDALGMEEVDITSYYHLNDENYIAALDGVNKISYAIGHKNVTADGEERELVAVMVRGTSVSVEWNSNSNVANSVADGKYDVAYHEGFQKSAEYAYEGIKKYLADHSIDGDTAILWIMAHSRGASIANVLASMFNEDQQIGFPKEHVYSYNFSSSPTTRRADASGEAFDNIFNVMNTEDYIARIPPVEWGFKRFGRDLYFPGISNSYDQYRQYRSEFLKLFKQWTRVDFPAFHGNAQTNWFQRNIYDISPNATDMYCRNRYSQGGTISFAQYFRIFTDIASQHGMMGLAKDGERLAKYGRSVFDRFLDYFLRNQIGGHDAPGAHQEEGYLIKLMLCYQMGIDIEKNSVCDTRRFTVYGPIELMAYDEAGRVVADMTKGNINENLYNTENFISMYYDKDTDATQIWVPNSMKATIKLRSLDRGTHDCTWTTLTPMGDVLEQEFYADVSIPRDDFCAWADIAPAQPTHASKPGDNLCAEVEIQGTKDAVTGDELLMSWSDYGDSVLGFQGVNVVADALPARNATYGDHVAVHAFCDKHLKFAGWFEEGADLEKDKPLCKDDSYVFRIEGNRKLIALFERR